MNEFELNARPRAETGKGAARRMRRTGWVPGVLYGAGKEAQAISLPENTLRKQLENEAFFSHILTVKVDGEGQESQVVLKALQRDPASSRVIHVDLQRVSSTQEITMNVPLHFINEETSPGRRHGGVISHLMVDVEVVCLPKDLPEYIEVEMGALDIGDSVHLSEVTLPEGVRLVALLQEDPDQDQPLVTIAHPQKLDVEEEEPAEEVEGEVPTGEAASAEEEKSGDED